MRDPATPTDAEDGFKRRSRGGGGRKTDTGAAVGAHRVTFRPGRVDDLDELMEMWQESVSEISPVDPVAAQVDLTRKAERRHFFELLLTAADAGVAVAEIDAIGLVGMMTYQEFSNPAFFTVTRLALLSSVHVRPGYRRLGICQLMTEWTLDWLRRRGVEEVQLANSPRNEAADRTWEKLGFEVITVNRRRML